MWLFPDLPLQDDMRLRLAPLLFFPFLLLTTHPSATVAQDFPQRIRVRLFERSTLKRGVLHAKSRLTLYTSTHDAPLAHLEAGEKAILSVRGVDVRVALPDGALYTRTLRVVPAGGAQWRLAVTTSSGGRQMRTYTGRLHVAPAPQRTGLRLINEAPLPDYVAGIVAAEYGLGDLAGAKAMAVAVRTYALRHAARGDSAQTDNTAAQVYRGIGAITPTARQAARATRGEVLTYDGRLIEAVYFSASGGHTADNEDVWNAERALPYLRGRSDPHAGNSPHARWRTTIDRSHLLNRLSQRYGFDVQGFLVGERSEDGRVATIELLDSSGEVRRAMQSNAFRLFVNRQVKGRGLRSTLFEARRSGDHYVFEGSGYGHGVGMSQYGAHAMATAGYGYRKILQFYYTDVHLAHLDALDKPLPTPTVPVARHTPTPAPDSTEADADRRIGW